MRLVLWPHKKFRNSALVARRKEQGMAAGRVCKSYKSLGRTAIFRMLLRPNQVNVCWCQYFRSILVDVNYGKKISLNI